jgi:hypothetical protein
MEVLFAPDWRDGVPYQRLLGKALGDFGIRVEYLGDYRRFLPLWRLTRDWRRRHRCDLLHLHWPEAYYPKKGDGWDWFRCARFGLDLWLATRGLPLAVTAHNLHAHNRKDPFAFRNTRAALHRARVVFAHSEVAKQLLEKKYGLSSARIRVIPQGDLSVTVGPPLSRKEARRELGLGEEKVCLMFGAVESYKGLEEAIEYWREAQPLCHLHIAGKPCDANYAASVKRAAEGVPRVHLHLGWLADETLRVWLSATDAVLFNYRTIFTSGAATLARSYGVPQLLPARLTTVDLAEPALTVIRFLGLKQDFSLRLDQALAQPHDYAGAAGWRAQTSWARVAELTAAGYKS